jgi:hypothetical protein
VQSLDPEPPRLGNNAQPLKEQKIRAALELLRWKDHRTIKRWRALVKIERLNGHHLLYTALKTKTLVVLIPVLLTVLPVALRAMEPDPSSSVDSAEILDKYVQASENLKGASSGGSMEVDINASVPKLKANGRLHALRVMSHVGRITYRVLGFQGSNAVKTQVIARYLQAEQQGQSNPRLAVAPTNYKFKFKGARRLDSGKDAFIFALTPKKREPGLFKGEIWLDASTYLPVYEKGRFVKNPTIFFKKVEFERAFAIKDGKPLPQYMNSTITTRVVGKVELDVNYSNYAPDSDGTEGAGSSLSAISFSTR